MSLSSKKRQHPETLPLDSEPKKTCPLGCDDNETPNTPWRLPASALGNKDNQFVLCTVDDMPQPSDGFVLLTWVQQCASSSYPESHDRYMIPWSKICASDWQKLVTVNNVIAGPLEPLEEYSSSSVKILQPLLSHSSGDSLEEGPFLPSFLSRMKEFRVPYCAIIDTLQVRQFILTGCINE